MRPHPCTGPEGRKATVFMALALTWALSLADSSASRPFFLALEEREAAFPSALSACLVLFSASARSLSRVTPAVLCRAAWSWGPGNCAFTPADPVEPVSGPGHAWNSGPGVSGSCSTTPDPGSMGVEVCDP